MRKLQVGFEVKYTKDGKSFEREFATSFEEAEALGGLLLKTGKAKKVWVSQTPESIPREARIR